MPIWAGPLTFFWGCCSSCNFSGQVDDGDFRQWKKKNTKKYLASFQEGALDSVKTRGILGQGPLGILKKGHSEQDMYLRLLSQFYSGVFTETLKTSPLAGTLGRSYLRIAWIFRDVERLFSEFDPEPAINLLKELKPTWDKEILPFSNYPVVPSVAMNEVEALRFATAYFEWNFQTLSSASGIEDEMRLMTLIAEISYRIYELTGDADDFQKAQSGFSGTMQKCLSVVDDKSIVGGAVNRAKDTLEKAGDRGRELRTLREKYEKDGLPETAPTPPPPVAKDPETAPKPTETEPESPEPTPALSKPAASPAPAETNGSASSLQRKIDQLDQENRRWMRLAGMSELTGLPTELCSTASFYPAFSRQSPQRNNPSAASWFPPKVSQRSTPSMAAIPETNSSKSLPNVSRRSSEKAND
jgi:hypothetical protein